MKQSFHFGKIKKLFNFWALLVSATRALWNVFLYCEFPTRENNRPCHPKMVEFVGGRKRFQEKPRKLSMYEIFHSERCWWALLPAWSTRHYLDSAFVSHYPCFKWLWKGSGRFLNGTSARIPTQTGAGRFHWNWKSLACRVYKFLGELPNWIMPQLPRICPWQWLSPSTTILSCASHLGILNPTPWGVGWILNGCILLKVRSLMKFLNRMGFLDFQDALAAQTVSTFLGTPDFKFRGIAKSLWVPLHLGVRPRG